ncbi:MAG: helix-hairpin-helix domain-containing protein, partial [Burkholderiales bacterium]
MPRQTKTKKLQSELQMIPGVGLSIAGDLQGIGISRVAQLKGKSPQALYDKLCQTTGVVHDRCVL